jgi:hypothetical protein
VVQSLLDGLKSRDKVVNLMDRLLELPTELNELFSVTLGGINPRYRAQAFRLLYITQQLLPHVRGEGVNTLVLSYAEEFGYITKSLLECRNICSSELEDRQQEIEVVIRSRCLGLLEVSFQKTASRSELAAADFQRLTTNLGVDYIHRSVAEYLDDIDINARVAETSASGFDVNVAILNALAITCQYGIYSRFLVMFSRFNLRAEYSTKEAQLAAIGELDYHPSRIHQSYEESDSDLLHTPSGLKPAPGGHHWANYVLEDYNRPCPWHDTTLAFAIRCGWELYVVWKLTEHGRGLPAKQGRPLLDYAVLPDPVYSLFVYGMNANIVSCLLRHGADPNARIDGRSAWSNALYALAVFRRGDIDQRALQIVEVMKLLLAYGASKKASCVLKSGKTSAADVVRLTIFNPDDKFPDEVRTGLQEVLAIIEDKKSNGDRVQKMSTTTKSDEAEDQIALVSFDGSSRSKSHNTLLPQKASLCQRLKAKLLKRTC